MYMYIYIYRYIYIYIYIKFIEYNIYTFIYFGYFYFLTTYAKIWQVRTRSTKGTPSISLKAPLAETKHETPNSRIEKGGGGITSHGVFHL